MTQREKRLLMAAPVAAGLILWYSLSSSSTKTSSTVLAAPETVSAAEIRLNRVRRMSALVPGKEAALKNVQTELAVREKGILDAPTPQQAQAQLFQIMRRVMSSENPPIQIGSTEIGPTRVLNDNYGEVLATVSFTCRIEDLVNLLADLMKQPELVATSDIRIGGAHPKEKVMPVRLTVSGVVRRELIPDKKVSF